MKKYLFIIFILTSVNGYAWICPTNFNSINVGDSIEQVEQQCGTPTAKKTYEAEPNVPQEWNYYVSINQASPGGYPMTSTSTLPSLKPFQAGPEPSVKMTVAFIDAKVMNINVQEMSLSSTSICGPTINIGDTAKTVEAACGKPTLITKGEGQNKPKATEITEFKYNSTPPNTLVFEGGKLTERK